MAPICIHSQNPKIFEFKGKPIVLLCATEHYGAVMNRPFDFEKYLEDAAENKQTLTRLFTLFRELQGPNNPYSTCKPESVDYIAPFERTTGQGVALDGQPKYNLDKLNTEFYERLHKFLALANENGIIVEVVLFSNAYAPNIWALNPLNKENNINGLEEIHWSEYTTQRSEKLFERQVEYVKKIVKETNSYDNVIYEICNEPGGYFPFWDQSPTPEEVNKWMCEIVKLICQTEYVLSNKHLIAGQEAFAYKLPQEEQNHLDVHQFADKSFHEMPFDVVNMHPLSNMKYAGKQYDLGRFMAGQLRLKAFRDYCLASYNDKKPLNLDEDNAASQYRNLFGWTIHRKRAWVALFCGAHYDFIDFTITIYTEIGTTDSKKYIRTWMRYLSEFIHSIDLVYAKPLVECLKKVPDFVCSSMFAVENQDYSIYLADERESNEPDAGKPIEGDMIIDLPKGDYTFKFYNPVNGEYSNEGSLTGGENITIKTPMFVHDIVLRISKK